MTIFSKPIHVLHIEYPHGNSKRTIKIPGFYTGWVQNTYWTSGEYKKAQPYLAFKEAAKYKNHKVLAKLTDLQLVPTGTINKCWCIDVDNIKLITYLESKGIMISEWAQTKSCTKKLPHLWIKSDHAVYSDTFILEGDSVGDLKGFRTENRCDGVFENIKTNMNKIRWVTLTKEQEEAVLAITKRNVDLGPEYAQLEQSVCNGFDSININGIAQIMRDLIDKLPAYLIESYDDWVNWGLMFKLEFGEAGLAMWNYMSRKSPKYDEEANIRKWPDLKPDRNRTGINKFFGALKATNIGINMPDVMYQFHYQMFVKPNYVPTLQPHYYNEVYDEPYCRDFSHVTQRCIILDARMAAGKTRAVVKYVKEYVRKNKNVYVLLITPRITLSESQSRDYEATLYSEVSDTELNKAKKKTIQLESILREAVKEHFMLVLDEAVSTFTQLVSELTMDDNKRLLVNERMVELLQRAKKIIMIDAFWFAAVNRVVRMFVPVSDIYHIKNTNEYPKCKRVYVQYKNLCSKSCSISEQIELGVNLLVKLLKAGKKVYIHCSTKAMAEEIDAFLRHNYYKGKFYHGGMDGKLRKDFKNVTLTWQDADYIVATTAVTVGLSFDLKEHFDCVIYFANPVGPTVRDSQQSLARVRFPVTNKIYVLMARSGRPKGFNKRKDIEADYAFRAKELGLDTCVSPAIKENVISNELERINSAVHFEQMLEDYFIHRNAQDFEYEDITMDIENPKIIKKLDALSFEYIDEIHSKIGREDLTAEEKRVLRVHMLTDYFKVEIAPDLLETYVRAPYELVYLLQNPQLYHGVKNPNVYLLSNTLTLLPMYRTLFESIGIIPATMFTAPETFVSNEMIAQVDAKILCSILQINEPTVGVNEKQLRSALKYLHLNFTRVRKTKKHTVSGYEIIDADGLWSNVRNFQSQ